MTADLGTFALDAALVVALFGMVCIIAGLRRSDHALIEAGARAVPVWAAFIALAAAALLYALLTRDFSVRFVAETTNRDLPLGYTITAFWGGHAGSLLLWALILGLYGTAAGTLRRGIAPLTPYVNLVLLITAAFFTVTLAFSSNPFTRLRVPPPDGAGLNPLLRNPWMAAHPPALYLGFVGMTVPFALTVAALIAGRYGSTWTASLRRWVLTSWLFLTLGLLFGAKWSYVVLGWGGYWAWDPVENAALMPWLTGTAILHSIQITEHDGLLAGWTAALVLLAFGLSILGTFLTRSGLLSSVHAFAESTVGIYFLVFLGVTVIGSFGLLFWRRDTLRVEATVDSVLSREAAFLANNVLLVIAAGAVLFGTLFPMLTEALTGDRINVGPPYYNQVMIPVIVLLLVLMAVGPLLSWQGSRPAELRGLLTTPAAAGVLVGTAGAVRIHNGMVSLVLASCAFAAGTVVLEYVRGVRLRRAHGEPVPVAIARLIARNQRRYGGYVVHFGILLVLVGITISSAFATRTQAVLAPGERLHIGRYEVRYDGAQAFRGPDLRVTAASVTAIGGGAQAALVVRHLYHVSRDAVTAQVGIHSTWRDDLYVVLLGLTTDGRATFRVLLNPMVRWIWVGGVVVVLGGIIAALPMRRREEVGA